MRLCVCVIALSLMFTACAGAVSPASTDPDAFWLECKNAFEHDVQMDREAEIRCNSAELEYLARHGAHPQNPTPPEPARLEAVCDCAASKPASFRCGWRCFNQGRPRDASRPDLSLEECRALIIFDDGSDTWGLIQDELRCERTHPPVRMPIRRDWP